MAAATTSYLSPTQKYAAGALFGLALHQAHLHQTHPLGLHFYSDDDQPSTSDSAAVSEDPHLWVHHSSGLLHPVFKYLDIDSGAWSGLEETAGSSSASRHVGPFLRLLSADFDDDSQRSDQELALSEAVDAMACTLEKIQESSVSKREKIREYEHQCREKFSNSEAPSESEKEDMHFETPHMPETPYFDCKNPPQGSTINKIDESPIEEI
ncbi:hypothetical protein Ahy_Scaffold1g106677 isoform G [Arachis hypogaea]|uniref:Uncharacterized protein n=1 Tax=Arachis hypogaea TaxID=3818 RepID=A0A444WR97_ARAHY|nr:hypothetical protein Ahy_Scaffold1g106677 isoform G [Arachis hypogaea]